MEKLQSVPHVLQECSESRCVDDEAGAEKGDAAALWLMKGGIVSVVDVTVKRSSEVHKLQRRHLLKLGDHASVVAFVEPRQGYVDQLFKALEEGGEINIAEVRIVESRVEVESGDLLPQLGERGEELNLRRTGTGQAKLIDLRRTL